MDIDKELIDRVRQGDERAFTSLFLRLSNSVASYINLIVNDKQLAEDLAVDVFSKLPKIIHYYDYNKAQFSTWFFKIAKNYTISYLRHKDETDEIPFDESYMVPESEYKPHYSTFHIEELDEVITPLELTIISLSYVYKHNLNEIAKMLNLTRPQVKFIRKKAFEKIKKYYIEQYM